jgi:transposase
VRIELITVLSYRIRASHRAAHEQRRADETAWQPITVRGVGPVTALALVVAAPPPETLGPGLDLAAWIGLTPRQHFSGGIARLGRTSNIGQRDLRRLLIIGASAVVRWARRPELQDRVDSAARCNIVTDRVSVSCEPANIVAMRVSAQAGWISA